MTLFSWYFAVYHDFGDEHMDYVKTLKEEKTPKKMALGSKKDDHDTFTLEGIITFSDQVPISKVGDIVKTNNVLPLAQEFVEEQRRKIFSVSSVTYEIENTETTKLEVITTNE